MDPDVLLADLREIAPQLEAMVILGEGGEPVASTLPETAEFAAALARLLEAARGLRPGGERAVERLHVTTGAGSVYLVAGRARTIAAVTGTDAAPALVLYDLRTALARLERDPDPDPADARA